MLYGRQLKGGNLERQQMRVHFAGRYDTEELETEFIQMLRTLRQNQIGSLVDIDIRFIALDLDERETFAPDGEGRHAGIRFSKPDEAPDDLRLVSWYIPWLSGCEWPDNNR